LRSILRSHLSFVSLPTFALLQLSDPTIRPSVAKCLSEYTTHCRRRYQVRINIAYVSIPRSWVSAVGECLADHCSSSTGECKKAGKILASFIDPRQAFGPDKIIPPEILAGAKVS
jgi:hypothetical protein